MQGSIFKRSRFTTTATGKLSSDCYSVISHAKQRYETRTHSPTPTALPTNIQKPRKPTSIIPLGNICGIRKPNQSHDRLNLPQLPFPAKHNALICAKPPPFPSQNDCSLHNGRNYLTRLSCHLSFLSLKFNCSEVIINENDAAPR